MNTGIITSFVIGGLLLLSLLSMNLNISRSSTSLTMRQITQQNMKATAEILSYDFPKIGFERYDRIPDIITTAHRNKIIFKSNIDDFGAVDTVEWFFDTSDSTLLRKIDGSGTNITTGVTAFKITYQDENLDPIPAPVTDQAALNKIRHIKIEMTITSKEKLGKVKSTDGEYIRSFWTKTFSPLNLK